MSSFREFIKGLHWKKNYFLILLLILIGSFFRFYRLQTLMTYLGDEGRDMLIVLDIVQGKNFPFIGPPTSVGELYLGPIYYYFITPFAYVFKMSPIGPAVFVGLIGIMTIPLIYLVGKMIFNRNVGIIAAIYYTISPLTIRFSRSSWNPNPMPFFSLLLIFFLLYAYQTKKTKYLYLGVVAYGIMLQLHYLVVILIPFLGFCVFRLTKIIKAKKSLLISILIFILLFSPLMMFDFKHNFVNAKGLIDIFQTRSTEGFNLLDLFSRSRDRLRQLYSLFFGFLERGWQTNILVISSIFFLLIDWIKNKKFSRSLIFGWFIWGMIAIGLYRQSFYPHYLGFLFIFPAILFGNTLNYLIQCKKLKFFSYFFGGLLILNMIKIAMQDLTRPPVLNIKLVQKIVRLIQKESQQEEFNFALLALNNYDDSYRYFFRLWEIPAAYKTEVTKQLFVVCEDLEICQPEGNPKWEIALFDAAYKGKIKIAGEWQPDPVMKIYRFIPDE